MIFPTPKMFDIISMYIMHILCHNHTVQNGNSILNLYSIGVPSVGGYSTQVHISFFCSKTTNIKLIILHCIDCLTQIKSIYKKKNYIRVLYVMLTRWLYRYLILLEPIILCFNFLTYLFRTYITLLQ